MKKIMGLDVGNRKIGVALSDLLQITAQPYKTVKGKNKEENIAEIAKIIKENDIDTVVVGLPKNMDNSLGEQSQRTKKFIEELLEKTGQLNIQYIDERLSSKEALRDLSHLNMKKIKDNKLIDTVAAVKILETYLMRIN